MHVRNRTLGRMCGNRDVAAPDERICGHFGIDPGTKQNRNGNIVPVLRAYAHACRCSSRMQALFVDSLGCINRALTTSATWFAETPANEARRRSVFTEIDRHATSTRASGEV